MSRVDYGTKEVTIDGETYTLTPTLNCVRNIKRWGLGSPMEAVEACRKFDPDALAVVVASGAGLGQKQLEKLADAIHYEGTVNVTAPVIEFLAMLLNPTGKDDEDEVKEDKDEGE